MKIICNVCSLDSTNRRTTQLWFVSWRQRRARIYAATWKRVPESKFIKIRSQSQRQNTKVWLWKDQRFLGCRAYKNQRRRWSHALCISMHPMLQPTPHVCQLLHPPFFLFLDKLRKMVLTCDMWMEYWDLSQIGSSRGIVWQGVLVERLFRILM